MSIHYKATKNANNLKGNKEDTYYARAISDGEISSEKLLAILAKKTKLHKADCFRFMLFLEETMAEQLAQGKIVRLGDIGYFQVGISAKGVASEDEVTPTTISAAKINFRAGKSVRTMLKSLTYEKVKE
jgi:predicted histone-like DNA-binding protein